MLVLTRSCKNQEQIMLGDDIKITVLGIYGHHVRLGIEAPKDITIHRKEIYDKIHGIVEDDDTRGNY